MDVNRNAPVRALAETQIDAPVGLVWQVLCDIRAWPSWNPAVSTVSMYGEFETGTEFQWRADGVTMISRLQEIETNRRLLWTGRIPGLRATHVWEFEEREGLTHVRSEECAEGLLARLLSRVLSRMLSAALERALQSLKQVCEQQAAGR